MSETTGCSCGGHGEKTSADGAAQDERAAAPQVAQPLGEGYVAPESAPRSASSFETADLSAIAANVTAVLGDGTVQVAVPAGAPQPAAGSPEGLAAQGVVPGHKAGNLLGLRDVSASQGGGCGCGGHGHHHGNGEGHGAGGCACGAH